MPTICGRPHVPREVRSTTPSRVSGSGPKKEVNAPESPSFVADGICERARWASMKPPLSFSTAAMTSTMPTSMMRPWMKSLIAVAM